MKHAPIEGHDINHASPVNGVIHVAGFIRNPHQLIRIKWDVDGVSGSTDCQAWAGQHEIDGLVKEGYRILSISHRLGVNHVLV